ncbi:MAG TPA: DUF6659 family protein [Nitrososphaera sp.]|nr:DUF6659 family protein [Nitrososphaera sp.]
MQQPTLCERIIKLDRNIRFVGVVSGRGEVIEGGFQEGIQPLLDGIDEQQMYVQSLANMTALRQYADRLGKVRYSLTEHEKVTLFTFPLGDGILCLSASSKADPIKIRDKVIRFIKDKPGNRGKIRKQAKG